MRRLIDPLTFRLRKRRANALRRDIRQRTVTARQLAERGAPGVRLWPFGAAEVVEAAAPAGLPPEVPPFLARHLGRHTLPEPYVAEVAGVRLARLRGGGGGDTVFTFGLTAQGAVLWETITRHEPDYYLSILPRLSDDRIALLGREGLSRPAEAVFATACLLPGDLHINYAHWTLEVLTRLEGVERYQQITGQPVLLLIGADAPPWVERTLADLGYGPDRWQRVGEGIFRVERLVLPSWRSLDFFIAPAALSWLRERLAGPAAASDAPSPSRLYLSRGSFRRPVTNEEAVVTFLADRGFLIVRPEQYSLAGQARLLSRAEWVVAPQGAALANLVFTPPGCRIIDCTGSLQTHAYYGYAASLGRDYRYLLCPYEGKAMSIPVDQLARLLADG